MVASNIEVLEQKQFLCLNNLKPLHGNQEIDLNLGLDLVLDLGPFYSASQSRGDGQGSTHNQIISNDLKRQNVKSRACENGLFSG